MDNLEESNAVAEELLADALTCRVDGNLQTRARVQQRRHKKTYRYGFAKTPRRRYEDFLVDGGPAVELEQARIRLAKKPWWVCLKQDAHHGVEEALVKEPLVIGSLPPAAVQCR